MKLKEIMRQLLKKPALGMYVRTALLIGAGLVILYCNSLEAILEPIDLHIHTPMDDWNEECAQKKIDEKEYDRACERIDNGHGRAGDCEEIRGWERENCS